MSHKNNKNAVNPISNMENCKDYTNNIGIPLDTTANTSNNKKQNKNSQKNSSTDCK